MTARQYAYVGPEAIRADRGGAEPGTEIRSQGELRRWALAHARDAEGAVIPATFVVTPDGELRLAARRSEHVACAAGGAVLTAGELFVAARGEPRVVEASNLSTGYCPEPSSWPALAAALDRAGIVHPGRFTSEFVFRRCPACGERNLVKDADFACALCGAELPQAWNFGGPG